MNWLPKHSGSLCLSHNDHLDVYESVSDYYRDLEDFISQEEYQKCLETNNVWSLIWYPETPVGFCVIRAASLEAIQQQLKENSNA
jgi:hypothetical protein